MQALLVGISKVEINICDRCLSGIAHSFDIVELREEFRIFIKNLSKIDRPENALARAGYKYNGSQRGLGRKVAGSGQCLGTHVFRESKLGSPLISTR